MATTFWFEQIINLVQSDVFIYIDFVSLILLTVIIWNLVCHLNSFILNLFWGRNYFFNKKSNISKWNYSPLLKSTRNYTIFVKIKVLLTLSLNINIKEGSEHLVDNYHLKQIRTPLIFLQVFEFLTTYKLITLGLFYIHKCKQQVFFTAIIYLLSNY